MSPYLTFALAAAGIYVAVRGPLVKQDFASLVSLFKKSDEQDAPDSPGGLLDARLEYMETLFELRDYFSDDEESLAAIELLTKQVVRKL